MKSAHFKPSAGPYKPSIRPRCNNAHREPVQVFCRLKPCPPDASCIKVISNTSIIITHPESSTNSRNANRAIETTFSRVLPQNASQQEVFNIVALPLVENLINGKSSLLFAYGVSGSGKTYTMMGVPYYAGIMPRCLHVIFNSIVNYQAKKYIFKPDRLNGFDVQSAEDALLDRQNQGHDGFTVPHNGKTNKFATKSESDSDGNTVVLNEVDETQTLNVDQDNVYAVFITYVEIYNNSVYDLLDEEVRKQKARLSERMGTEICMFMGVLKWRSHSVFTVRLVQAPLDSNGEQVVQDKRAVTISQLSLVDLAGSERSNRSKNTGQRLREAGNINNSLMTLRSCLEMLRENQISGTNKIVPYRDSKLTHLFKNYFEGDGQVRMIICVNPDVDDYDESIQMMKFAEMTQEVQIVCPPSSKIDLGYTPGRRQANKLFKEARSRLEKAGHVNAAELEVDLGLVYSLGSPFPELEVTNPHNDQVITMLMRFLEKRIQKRNLLREDLQRKQNDFRNMLVKLERENVSLRIENVSLRATNDEYKNKISSLEAHVCKTESQIDALLYRLNSNNNALREMQQELKDRDMTLNQHLINSQKVKQKYNTRIQVETDKMNKDLEIKLRKQREILENQMKEKEEKINLMKRILVDDNGDGNVTHHVKESIPSYEESSEKDIPVTPVPTSSKPAVVPHTIPKAVANASSKVTHMVDLNKPQDFQLNRVERIPVVNPRYRRSQSADRWIDHRPGPLVPVGTIFQPLMHNKRSVTQLTNPKDFMDKASRYCLVSQEQDTSGELETKLYKADILPTAGGGAQVVFNDIECLKQVSPVANRKRASHVSPQDKKEVPSTSNNGNTVENNSKRQRL
ncbi:hypothetical protein KM043_011765 [Ampulex compressa]|nr:hypothetical protein KM043_011765 [Ampulex compressa]